jgi:nitric oxide reductase NorD protein
MSLRLAQTSAETMGSELPNFERKHERVMASVLQSRTSAKTRRLSPKEEALEQARRSALKGDRSWDTPELWALLSGPRRGTRRSPEVAIWGSWFEGEAESLGSANLVDAHAREEKPTTEVEAPAVDSIQVVEFASDEKKNPPPSVPFERAETLDSYQGPGRDFDGGDELNAHLDALEEVDLGSLVRGAGSAQSLLRGDLDLGRDVAETGREDAPRSAVYYDEWDARKGRYQKKWCAVYPARAAMGDPEWARGKLVEHRNLIRKLRARLEAARTGIRGIPRQLDGEEIDLDAATDAIVSLAAGCHQDVRVYRRQRKRRRDHVTTVLLDVSMSTDSWIEGRRTLDVGREAALVLGQVADELGDRLEILAFASETRNRCHVWEVKGFGESWVIGKGRLAGLRPTGYTRVGPALRHATAKLLQEEAEARLLLLISDAKPTDYDRYEGRYGLADVRKALDEAEKCGVRTHALAIDSVARDHLPALFGRNRWDALRHPDELLDVLTIVYGRLTSS